MKIHFLGTAAAEGIPNPHCTCDTCETARKLGGKNIRSRTSVIIDDVLKVDDPPDTFYQAMRDKLDLSGVKDLLITHTHGDHFTPADMENRIEGFAHGIRSPLHIYGNDLAVKGYKSAFPDSGDRSRFAFHRVLAYHTITTQTAVVTPLLADHDPNETCLLYFIEKDGKGILYGNDTGWLPEETWEWLKNKKLDAAILDCTGGYTSNKQSRNHMCIETVIEVKKRFVERNMLQPDTQVIATHFTHNAGLQHDDFTEALDPHGIKAAYDGMIMHI